MSAHNSKMKQYLSNNKNTLVRPKRIGGRQTRASDQDLDLIRELLDLLALRLERFEVRLPVSNVNKSGCCEVLNVHIPEHNLRAPHDEDK